VKRVHRFVTEESVWGIWC